MNGMQSSSNGQALMPGCSVQVCDGATVATSALPWLRLKTDLPIKPNRWMGIRYRSSLFSDNVRPLIRFESASGPIAVAPMNGSLFGSGEWIGYIPGSTTAISICPVDRTGAFAFEIEHMRYISALGLLAQGVLQGPKWGGWAVETYFMGAREESRRALKLASSPTSFTDYDRWRRRLSRRIDLEGIDKPRSDWRVAPSLRIFMSVDTVALPALQKTVRSLLSQYFSRWTLHYLLADACSAEDKTKFRDILNCDGRIHEVAPSDGLAAVTGDASDDDMLTLLSAGDELPDYALAVVAESLAREPALRVIYGDEESVTLAGQAHSPLLKPDWSQYFNAAVPYLGKAVFLRRRDLLHCGVKEVENFVATRESAIAAVLACCEGHSIRHIRRVLYRTTRELQRAPMRQGPQFNARPRSVSPGSYPDAAVIVPTRDNADLLAQCVAGLMKNTDYPGLALTIVDNGSVKPDALALLRDLRTKPGVTVLERPGPFNFSMMCNDGADASHAPMLVFLNDDIMIRDSGWLKPLVNWAARPDVGIAGAKLLFPNGRIQHAGLVLGLGGIAAHLYHNQDPRQRGYLDGMTEAREVAAVTAACVAIEREKFNAAGRFDAINLPVELNDIDLCLRLGERGLSTIWTPESVLIHLESATRGKSAWSAEKYRTEREFFVSRWQAAIRDDRFFHPDLSLYSDGPALA